MRKAYRSEMDEIRLGEDGKKRILASLELRAEALRGEGGDVIKNSQVKEENEWKEERYIYKIKPARSARLYKIIPAAAVFLMITAAVWGLVSAGRRGGNPVKGGTEDSNVPDQGLEADMAEEGAGKQLDSLISKMAASKQGAAMPYIAYLDNNRIMLQDFSGFVIYDLEKRVITGGLDTEKYGINHIQGSDYTDIMVNSDGSQVLFANMETKENRYLYDVAGGTAERTELEQLTPVYRENLNDYDPDISAGLKVRLSKAAGESRNIYCEGQYARKKEGYYYLAFITEGEEYFIGDLNLVFDPDPEGKDASDIILYPVFEGYNGDNNREVLPVTAGLAGEAYEFLFEYDGWMYAASPWTREEAEEYEEFSQLLEECNYPIESLGRIERMKDGRKELVEKLLIYDNGPFLVDTGDAILFLGSRDYNYLNMKSPTLIMLDKKDAVRTCYDGYWNQGPFYYDNGFIYYSNNWQLEEGWIRICRMKEDFSQETAIAEVKGRLLSVADGNIYYVDLPDDGENGVMTGSVYLLPAGAGAVKAQEVSQIRLRESEYNRHYRCGSLMAYTRQQSFPVTNQQIPYTIINEADVEYETGKNTGILEIMIGYDWYALETEQEIYGVNGELETIVPYGTLDTSLNISYYYQDLVPGRYRIIRTARVEGVLDNSGEYQAVAGFYLK